MASIVRQTFDKGVLDADAIILMRVNFDKLPAKVVDMVGGTYIGPRKLQERDMVWFDDGYVTAETPRDAMLTTQLQRACVGYALALLNGKILKTYAKKDGSQAWNDLNRVESSISVNVNLADEEADEAAVTA